MHIKDVKSVTIRNVLFAPRPVQAPEPYIVARRAGDPSGSYTVFSRRLEDIARAAPENLHVEAPGSYWAMLAYCTSFEAVCAALDFLALPTQAEMLLSELKAAVRSC